MLWAPLPAHLNHVMPGVRHCVLTLMNVLMVLRFAILVLECALLLWAVLPARVNQVMLGM